MRQLLPFNAGVISPILRYTRSQMPESRPFFTITRLGLILWASAMLLLVLIPQRYWHYPTDLWLRIVVMVPALAAIGLFLFDEAKQRARDRSHIRVQPSPWRNLEVVLVMLVVAGIVYWKFKS